MTRNKQKPLLPNTFVRIRPLQEIVSTLDQDGTLDALPFMPEMAKYCSMRFMISKRIERTCEESERTMRRIRNVVFLDHLRCDGSSHGDCQKGCMLFWKEAWLEPDDKASKFRGENVTEGQTTVQLPSRTPSGLYSCQSTELIRATTPLALLDLTSYIRDIRSKTFSIPELIRNVSYAFFLKIRYRLIGTPSSYLEGQQVHTPEKMLNLQPGEWVQVKTKKEILETVDTHGMNRGLTFTLDMVEYCGKTCRVLRRLETMIHEPSRKLIHLNDTVILEDSICKGCNLIKGGCPRENFNFWREIWLKRVISL
jgi:hypothetical protein